MGQTMLQRLSTTIASLYGLAQEAEPERFHSEVLGLLRTLVDFDTAILETGHANARLLHAAEAHPARDATRITALLAEAQTPQRQEETLAYFATLAAPQRLNTHDALREHPLACLRDLAIEDGCCKLLLFGDVRMPQVVPRWLVLCRAGDEDFSESEAALLRACWPHLLQAVEFNLRQALDRVDAQHAKRALSLVNSRGVIEIADSRWYELLKLEWSGFDCRSLPQEALAALLERGVYRGNHIELNAFHRFGYLTCSARRLPVSTRLSPSETNAARHFASGMTHSEIAQRLGVSRHTIRNQLANVYQKLGVHSKAELIRVISNA